ncbi:MAG: helix-turn-helix transcriptional regulator [Bacteriovoracaceae bacterium]|nr:helix-turn-helix transcriptional regulator [Bacteriovoracaceae bacterium]
MKLELHKNLKNLLEKRGMTASQLSRATKVPNSTIQNWLTGLEPRNLLQLKKVADYFDVTVDLLLYGNKKDKERDRSAISEYADEINAGTFEVVLRRVKR